MKFTIDKSIEIMQNTPRAMSALLNNLSQEWTSCNEGENTWTVCEVIAHLIICEEDNWLPRVKIILSDSESKTFLPVDMSSQHELAANTTLENLIARFTHLRKTGIAELKALDIREANLFKTAMHPMLGEVNLHHLLATWVAHDLTHIGQISRIMAKQYNKDIGPYIKYLTRLN